MLHDIRDSRGLRDSEQKETDCVKHQLQYDNDTKTFDGQPEHYRTWASKVKDHLATCHQPWARLLDLIQTIKELVDHLILGRRTNFVCGVGVDNNLSEAAGSAQGLRR